MAVVLLTTSAPEAVSNPAEPDTVLAEVKLNVPTPVIALVSRSKVQDWPDLPVKIATSRAEPTTRDERVAPVPGTDVTVTWLSFTLEQLAGMPVQVRLNTVREDSDVALIEKL